MSGLGRLPHTVSLLDIRLQTPLPNIIVLRGNDAEAESVAVGGRVVLCLSSSISVRSIMFCFYGVNKVRWAEVVISSARMPVERSQKQKSVVFEKKISFLPFHGTKTIGRGNYEFPFELQIPGDIPESIEPYQQGESLAFLVYKMKVTIERPGFLSNIVHRQRVRIIRTMPPFSLSFNHALHVEDVWTNKIEYNISIPMKTYELGSTIPVNMRLASLVKNLRISKITCSLREYITLKITSGYLGLPSKYEIARQISVAKIKGLPEDENEWKLQKTISIPNSLSSCIQNCDVKHIKVRHKLKIIIALINPDGHVSELRASLPIVLLIPPALLVNSEYYTYPSGIEFQLPSYNSHIYDRIWDGISSIHANQSSSARNALVPSHITNNSTNSTHPHNADPTRSVSNDPERQQHTEEPQNAIRDQENGHSQANNRSSRYFTPSDTPDIIAPAESTNQTSLQESEAYPASRPFPLGTNDHPLNTITDTDIQQLDQQESAFANDLSQVPSYYTANHPVSITATPISQSLPTYEASVSHPQQNINHTSTRQPQQTLRRRLLPLKLHTNRLFKVLFIRHQT